MLIENILGVHKRAPDILDCISNLSSDEVFTPPSLAAQMLDQLSPSVWTNPNLKWLDPGCKSGVFLREAAIRLMKGLSEEFPDESERRSHIFQNMLHGIAITELTANISRRSVYYTKKADGKYAVVKFKDAAGNIVYRRSSHKYVAGKCAVCGSPDALDAPERDGLENYAYTFIHEEEVFEMKFDVIIGNPPYQLEDGGYGASAAPIYQLFVEQAKKLDPKYLSFVIPARWFTDGKGLDGFRNEMINDRRISHLVDYPKLYDLFPGVKIRGGVCYFLWQRDYEGDCEVKTIVDGEVLSSMKRDLRIGGDVLVRDNRAVSILEKVRSRGYETLDKNVSARKPFNLPTNFANFKTKPFAGSLKLYGNHFTGFVKESEITKNNHLVSKYKVLVPKAGGGEGRFPDTAIAKPILIGPDEVCTETYLVVGAFDRKKDAERHLQYLSSRFARFLISLRKNTPQLSQDKFKFVPLLPLNQELNDEYLYELFELSDAEQQFIASMITAKP
jgi:site-specific DNA-methyltransferase (adenine-specific)